MKKIYLGLIGLVLIVAIVDCKQDSALMSEPDSDPNRNGLDLPAVGTVIYSELLRDDQVIEQSVDSLVNFGSEENPAYFYVNLSHTVNQDLVSERQANNCSFYSVTIEDLEKFISMYAEAQSLCNSVSMTNEEKQSAYHHLYNFLVENQIDGAQLVATTLQNPSLLNQTLESGKIIPEKPTLKPVKPEIQDLPEIPDDFLPYITNQLSTDDAVLDSILNHIVLRRDGLKLPYIIEDDSIEHEPDPYNTNTYVSYINDTDDNSKNYYDEKILKSPVYTCRYGTKGCPMVESEFYIEGWYNSKHKGDTKNILYVPYLKTMIKDVHIGATMHLKGSVTYTQPDIRYSDTDEYPVIGGGEVVITYGDSWKVKRVGRLRFTVDGKTGYKEEYWDNNE